MRHSNSADMQPMISLDFILKISTFYIFDPFLNLVLFLFVPCLNAWLYVISCGMLCNTPFFIFLNHVFCCYRFKITLFIWMYFPLFFNKILVVPVWTFYHFCLSYPHSPIGWVSTPSTRPFSTWDSLYWFGKTQWLWWNYFLHMWAWNWSLHFSLVSFAKRDLSNMYLLLLDIHFYFSTCGLIFLLKRHMKDIFSWFFCSNQNVYFLKLDELTAKSFHGPPGTAAAAEPPEVLEPLLRNHFWEWYMHLHWPRVCTCRR